MYFDRINLYIFCVQFISSIRFQSLSYLVPERLLLFGSGGLKEGKVGFSFFLCYWCIRLVLESIF